MKTPVVRLSQDQEAIRQDSARAPHGEPGDIEMYRPQPGTAVRLLVRSIVHLSSMQLQ